MDGSVRVHGARRVTQPEAGTRKRNDLKNVAFYMNITRIKRMLGSMLVRCTTDAVLQTQDIVMVAVPQNETDGVFSTIFIERCYSFEAATA